MNSRVIFLIFFLMALLTLPSTGQNDKAVIQKDEAMVRSGPGSYYPVSGTVRKGESYPVVERSGKWMRIKLAGDASGWIPESVASGKKGGFDLGSNLSKAVGSSEASSTTPTAGAKGFNADVEKKYAQQRGLDFSAVDAMEAYSISPKEMEAFLDEGGLKK
jgi:uncharacterized protein YgiM (DUF1202 family)